jgi:uncharacterized protein (DUF2147 family)|tara:strand:+ start:1311 stop:1745 length:435 start_codon:yes stop_codon:yes gene_type:complete
MKKFYSIISLSLISLSLVYGQEAEDILGLWANEDSTQIVQVMKQGNVFVGKLTNLKGDNSGSLLDLENPEIGKKSSTLIGLDVWIDFVYNEARHNWVDGKIYNFKNGNSYNGKIQIDEDALKLTGHYGFFFFLAKTQDWTRVHK